MTIKCGICAGKIRTGSYPSTSDFPCQYHSTIVPCSYLIHL